MSPHFSPTTNSSKLYFIILGRKRETSHDGQGGNKHPVLYITFKQHIAFVYNQKLSDTDIVDSFGRMAINFDFVLNNVQGKLLSKDSPIALPKSAKNPTEIEGMKKAHVSIIYISLIIKSKVLCS